MANQIILLLGALNTSPDISPSSPGAPVDAERWGVLFVPGALVRLTTSFISPD
jgi:hypothetical protein